MVEEKESGARDLLCIQGLQQWVLPVRICVDLLESHWCL